MSHYPGVAGRPFIWCSAGSRHLHGGDSATQSSNAMQLTPQSMGQGGGHRPCTEGHGRRVTREGCLLGQCTGLWPARTCAQVCGQSFWPSSGALRAFSAPGSRAQDARAHIGKHVCTCMCVHTHLYRRWPTTRCTPVHRRRPTHVYTCIDTSPHAHTCTDAGPHTGAHLYTDTGPRTHTHTCTDAHPHTGTHLYPDAGPHTGAHTCTDTGRNTSLDEKDAHFYV